MADLPKQHIDVASCDVSSIVSPERQGAEPLDSRVLYSPMFGNSPPLKPEPVLPEHLEMLFARCEFYEHPKTKEIGRFMPGDYWVSKKLVYEAWRASALRIEKWPWNVELTAEFICGPEIWEKYFPKTHKLGRCVKYFHDLEMLPLTLTNPEEETMHIYVKT